MINRKSSLACMLAAAILAGPGTADVVMAEEDEALGRLFYTPQQRAALDANVRQVVSKPVQAEPLPPAMTLGGIVTRSDGQRTIWVDGQAYHHGEPGNVRVLTTLDDPGGAEFKIEGKRKRLPVRVGQSLDPVSGETFEQYEVPPRRAHTSQQRPRQAPTISVTTSPTDSGAEPALKGNRKP